MKLEKRLRKLFVVVIVSLAFVSLTILNTVYAEGHNDTGTTGGGQINADDTTAESEAIMDETPFDSEVDDRINRSITELLPRHGDNTTGGIAPMYLETGTNTLFGENAGASLSLSTSTGIYNTFIGYLSGNQTTTGRYNTANGANALRLNTKGYHNTANGYQALYSNTTGLYNTANGIVALYLNTEGNDNTANGNQALARNTIGDSNTANGGYALWFNTEGDYNTANGGGALQSNTTGDNNTAIGIAAGFNNQTGSNNVFLGYEAGYNETGSNKLYIANNQTTTLIYGDFTSGDVGLGTTDPQRMLHLSSGSGTWIRVDSENKSNFLIGADQKGFAIYDDTKAKYRVVVKPNGNVGIGTNRPKGKLDVKGSIYQRGGVLHADYVFESDYALESIAEHADFMWKNKHLAAIPKATMDENGQEIVEVGAHRKGIVEELEKAHIYIEKLHKQNKELESRLAKLEACISEM